MRSCKCEQCGNRFTEDDSNPNVHYSTPAKICMHCEIINKQEAVVENFHCLPDGVRECKECHRPHSVENMDSEGVCVICCGPGKMEKDPINTNMVDDLKKSLAKKRYLTLEVVVKNEDEADELLNWMYGSDKPMSVELTNISWDTVVLSREEVEDLRKIVDKVTRSRV